MVYGQPLTTFLICLFCLGFPVLRPPYDHNNSYPYFPEKSDAKPDFNTALNYFTNSITRSVSSLKGFVPRTGWGKLDGNPRKALKTKTKISQINNNKCSELIN